LVGRRVADFDEALLYRLLTTRAPHRPAILKALGCAFGGIKFLLILATRSMK
jgi:hypothetical protein